MGLDGNWYDPSSYDLLGDFSLSDVDYSQFLDTDFDLYDTYIPVYEPPPLDYMDLWNREIGGGALELVPGLAPYGEELPFLEDEEELPVLRPRDAERLDKPDEMRDIFEEDEEGLWKSMGLTGRDKWSALALVAPMVMGLLNDPGISEEEKLRLAHQQRLELERLKASLSRGRGGGGGGGGPVNPAFDPNANMQQIRSGIVRK